MTHYFDASRYQHPILPLYTEDTPPKDFEEALIRIVMLENSQDQALLDIRSEYNPKRGSKQDCQRWKNRRHSKLVAVRYELKYLRVAYNAEIRANNAELCKRAQLWEKKWIDDYRGLLTQLLACEIKAFKNLVSFFTNKLQTTETAIKLLRLSRRLQYTQMNLMYRMRLRFEKRVWMRGYDHFYVGKVFNYEIQIVSDELHRILRMVNTKLGLAQEAERELAM